MKYRRFGKLDWQASVLGFGCMRLPVIDGKRECIDVDTATQMIRHGIDRGINYIDTAYAYHDGESEKLLGQALRDGYREKVRLASKMPSWLIKEESDFDRYFNEQLNRLQTEKIDLYLLHTLNLAYWENLVQLGVFKWLEKAKLEGRIDSIGFSFHDEYPVFEKIVDGYNGWDFCQIQYNYLDVNQQAGLKGLRYAASRGLAVVIMEPLLGGKLANPPESVQAIFDSADEKRSAVDWALQWIWDQPEVSLLLSGMSAPEHVEENLSCAVRSRIGSLTENDHRVISEVQLEYDKMCPVPCTDCQYCLPCPYGVMIPNNMDLFNRGAILDQWGSARYKYREMSESERASACEACRECEEKCPQRIPISEWMSYIHHILGEEHSYDRATQPPPVRQD